MANPLCPLEQTNRRHQKCENTKRIQIRAGEAKAAANRKKRENKREGGKPGRKCKRERNTTEKERKGEGECGGMKKQKWNPVPDSDLK